MKLWQRLGLGLGLGVLSATAVIAGGCGKSLPVEQGVIVKGKLVQGRQPLSRPGMADLPPGMEEMAGYEIALVPQGGAEEHVRGIYYGEYTAGDGSVVFTGPGQGIPPGTYTLTVRAAESMPDDTYGDPFQGKLFTETSPFTFEVPAGKVGQEHDLGEIDLDNPPQ